MVKSRTYLGSYRHRLRELQSLEEELELLRSGKMNPTVVMDDMPHAHNATDLSGYAARYDELVTEITHKRIEVVEALKAAERLIDSVRSPIERYVGRSKYINGYTLGDIADELEVSYETVKRIHRRFLKQIDRCDPR